MLNYWCVADVVVDAVTVVVVHDVVVSRRQSSIICDVPYGSRYMKSVVYHAPKTVLENVYVIFGL
jgi:hypothetical protein